MGRRSSRRVTCRDCQGVGRPFDPTTIEFWACGTALGSNVAHAYSKGRTACGSPQPPSTQSRWESPGCIACKGCLKVIDRLKRAAVPDPPPRPNIRPPAP